MRGKSLSYYPVAGAREDSAEVEAGCGMEEGQLRDLVSQQERPSITTCSFPLQTSQVPAALLRLFFSITRSRRDVVGASMHDEGGDAGKLQQN